MKRAGFLALAMGLSLLAEPLRPCSLVRIGYRPVVVKEISGGVISFDMTPPENPEDFYKNLKTVPIKGTVIKVMRRTDSKVIEKKDVTAEAYRWAGERAHEFIGMVTSYDCGEELHASKSDEAGIFRMPKMKPGKYCLQVERPHPTEYNRYATFLIDVRESAKEGKLRLDISPLLPDCRGGDSVQVVSDRATRAS